jgi:hypothetical protein
MTTEKKKPACVRQLEESIQALQAAWGPSRGGDEAPPTTLDEVAAHVEQALAQIEAMLEPLAQVQTALTQCKPLYRQRRAQVVSDLRAYDTGMWLLYMLLLVGGTLWGAIRRVMLHMDLAWRERAPPEAPTSRLALPTVPELIQRQ